MTPVLQAKNATFILEKDFYATAIRNSVALPKITY
jgi:hypothetical protein